MGNMKVYGTIGRVDLTGLWLKINLFPEVKLCGSNGKTIIKYDGEVGAGIYIISEIAKACETTNACCRLEVNYTL